MDQADDRELVGRALGGDTEAYGELVGRYQQRLYFVAVKMLGDREAARDVTQDAFVRAYEKLSSYDAGRKFYTWIYRIHVNLCIDHLRDRTKRRSARLPEGLEGSDETPEVRVLGAELRRQVWSVLDALPAHYRALLVLRDVEGLSGKAIADSTGISHATVRWRIHRARQLFREAWERRHGARRGRGR